MTKEIVVQRTPRGRRVEMRIDGQPVSWADLPYYRLRLGQAILTTGGLAGVFTKPENRGQGLNRKVIERCVAVMTADGLDVSMLFGIPNYYHKFGFRTTLTDYEFTVAARDLIDGPMKLTARELPKARHGEILPLYRRWLSAASLGLERPSGQWGGFFRGQRGNVNVTITAFYRGRTAVGYVACDQASDAVRVPELVARDTAASRSIFTWLARQCRDKLCEKVLFTLPADDPASRMARDFGATHTLVTKANGGGMMRILNLSSTLAALQPELSALWARSSLGSRGFELTLRTDLGAGEIRLAGIRPSVPPLRGRATIPQNRLIQLISGYAHPADVAAQSGVTIPRSMLPALDVLFPLRCGTVLDTNRF